MPTTGPHQSKRGDEGCSEPGLDVRDLPEWQRRLIDKVLNADESEGFVLTHVPPKTQRADRVEIDARRLAAAMIVGHDVTLVCHDRAYAEAVYERIHEILDRPDELADI